MRTLILSANTGEGHNSCARALREEMDKRGIFCRVEDALRFISPGISRLISGGHVFIYRHLPGLFRWGYACVERHPAVFREDALAFRFLAKGGRALAELLREGGYDTVICTHPFAAVIVTAALRRESLGIQTALVATDYTCSPSVEQGDMDVHFIPHELLREDFVHRGIEREKLAVSGIPVRAMFYQHLSRPEAKKAFALPPEHRHLLLMCGSMGCGPVEKLSLCLAQSLPEDMELSIVCGTNRSLRRRLEKKLGARRGVHVLGYVEDISALMDSADLYLTKPGGISVSEAAVKKLPMVLMDAVAGCEEYNRRFFMERGAAVSAGIPEELAELSLELLRDDGRREKMSRAFESIEPVNAAAWICDWLSARLSPEKGAKEHD